MNVGLAVLHYKKNTACWGRQCREQLIAPKKKSHMSLIKTA